MLFFQLNHFQSAAAVQIANLTDGLQVYKCWIYLYISNFNTFLIILSLERFPHGGKAAASINGSKEKNDITQERAKEIKIHIISLSSHFNFSLYGIKEIRYVNHGRK